jgi:hypothetical protein
MMSAHTSGNLGRDLLRIILIVGYAEVVLALLSMAVLFLGVGRGWKIPTLQTVISAPLLPGLYLAASFHGKPTPGPGTPLPLVLGLAINCLLYSAIWFACTELWRRWGGR